MTVSPTVMDHLDCTSCDCTSLSIGDGDEDIVVAQNTGPPLLYENKCGNRNDWIKVQVKERCVYY